ncbi:uncharacterized protein LOC110117461 isoform X1 [Athalia rosae]|uniref:uncharacterized protein LOC110117461 isoform X1 n=1 Tax=Athalia rosae TaxID=37344 RepID=UPI00203355E3|nr:uncharacterized protein LOC110117461 isoform X1 [Athalia rosae]
MRNSPTSGATVTLRLIGRSIADFPRIRSAMCNRKGPLSRGTALIGRAICSEHHVYRESAKRVNNEAERGNFLLAKNMLFLKMNAAPGVSLFRATGKLHDKGRNEERPRGFPTDSRCDRHPAIASACRIRFRLLRSQCQGSGFTAENASQRLISICTFYYPMTTTRWTKILLVHRCCRETPRDAEPRK